MQYFLTVFVSAFLVFQIQPIASKIILPWFGGGAGVWTTCLLFFQFFLLAGYFYAFILSRFFKPKTQATIHLVLLIVSLLTLPIQLSSDNLTDIGGLPILEILKVLGFAIGLPFLLLSSTSPLLQSWFTSSYHKRNPYLLYAMSNLGSFLALLSYPILVEPIISLPTQTALWSSFYVFYILVIATICHQVRKEHIDLESKLKAVDESLIIPFSRKLLWFLLSAMGVVVLVSTTNAITQNVPPVPFLWIAPLAVYLATYVFAFSDWNVYNRKVWLPVYVFAATLGVLIYFIGGQFDIITQVVIYLFILLTATMICHGELSVLKPEQQNPTLFYLILSMGGVFGSFMVSVIAQVSFDDFLEFPVSLSLVFFLLGFALLGDGVCTVSSLSNCRVSTNGLSTHTIITTKKRKYWMPISSFVSGTLLFLLFLKMNSLYQQYDVVKVRNFYGVLSVKDVIEGNINERRLVDGTTAHGGQSLDPAKQSIPLSYYRPSTGVELVLRELPKKQSLNVGVVGLGVGALAAYGKQGDIYTFYELDPAVIDFANQHFSFIQNSKAKVLTKLGDARVSLQAELDKGQGNHFDVLVIDAFSGDQIPSHLLTQQAFLLYEQHIAQGGAIVLHISNRHLSLLPVVLGGAELLNMQVMFFSTSGGGTEHDAEWVVLTNNGQILENATLNKTKTGRAQYQQKIVQWTDDYSSLLPILKVLN